MSGELIIAALSEAWHKFGNFTGQEAEIARWVKRRVDDVKSGASGQTVAHPTLPRNFERSWYEPDEREPGSDDL